MTERSKTINVRTLSDDELFYGHKACPGCGGSLAVRIALKILGKKSVAVIPAGCMSAVGFNFPQLSFGCNSIISTFAGTASMMTGIVAGYKAQGIDDVTVVGFAGDGGTADIGIQALSGAIHRNDNMLYICYDNEAYMNTGIQKSSLTPFGAATTTSPAVDGAIGSLSDKKNLFEIVAAHGISYAATATVGDLPDFMRKLQKASSYRGTRFIHILSPCPLGWGLKTEDMVEVAREAVSTGLWIQAEFYDGEFHYGKQPGTFTDVNHYVRRQKRFVHLSDEVIKKIEKARDEKWLHINRYTKQLERS
ncbi:MAG: hypothetical protein J6I35_06990 [Ruminobacter sp.]|uniref:thiamine pyrophosphate-dependent enzyme n=1 Tax=Ruminobacter sp. TaxID=2774296 RepID=UPI001B549A3B|nr:thiamine pyrophosphate-dependent enzyme [Ruminobacter sp.]MBP3749277.1 hypothetical protein [Ruminobacter sp.]